jgi:hypothetical protein
MIEAALLAFGVIALIAAEIIMRRLAAIAARLVEVDEGFKTVREEMRNPCWCPTI